MKYKFMQDHKDEFNLERMSKVFNVSSSGYYKFIVRKPSLRKQEENRLLGRIRSSHENSRKTSALEFIQNLIASEKFVQESV